MTTDRRRGPHPTDPIARLAVMSAERVCLVKGLDLPCWVKTGYLDRKGYGRLSIGSRLDGTEVRSALAHRVAYRELIGPIPDGLQPDHLCRNPACWNPWHLEPVTSAVNTRRGRAAVTSHNSSKTHCPERHPYDFENTYRLPGGGRGCRACRRAADRRYRQRKAG